MAKKMAFSAIMMALAVLCLFGASTLPSAKISVLALTSVFGTVCVAEYGAKYGMIHYVGVSLLSLLLIPKKMMVIIYLLFIGYYPIVKMYVERLNKRWLEWILKLLIFNLFLVLAFFVFRTFFLPSLESILAKIAVYYWVSNYFYAVWLKFFKELVESLLNQTYSNWELCMADGSDDKHKDVEKICASYVKLTLSAVFIV